MKRFGFSLVEMLVATALSAVLMGAILAIVAGIARDRRRLDATESVQSPVLLIDRIRWDLTNADSMTTPPDGSGLVLVGHGGIDRDTLRPTGRLARVTYACRRVGEIPCLVREQIYLDSPAAPRPWRELVSSGVFQLRASSLAGPPLPVTAATDTASNPDAEPTRVPTTVLLQLQTTRGMISRELIVR